ncbi:MAG: virulence factor SrfB [Symbiopectobacterium sp.]
MDKRGYFSVRGGIVLGFRQLDNERWPATPLYTLTIIDQPLARKFAGGSVLHLRLAVARDEGQPTPESFEIADATLQDGSKVPLHYLRLRLNHAG